MNGPPLISGKFQLKKYPGKGGWTYLSLPKPPSLGRKSFGHNKVSCSIDGHAFEGLSIWNTKAGDLFFPVKAEIRKTIGKTDGDTVRIEIYPDASAPAPLPPNALQELLREEPEARRAFMKLAPGRQRELEDWIDAAPSDAVRVERLANIMDRLAGR